MTRRYGTLLRVGTIFALVGSLVTLFAIAGCSPAGPTRYTLSGDVTYDGQPVNSGVILLEPDTSRGNSGPGAVATIDGGHYRTAPGRGTVGGPHIARITAGTGVDVSELSPYGALHSQRELRVQVDVPKSHATHNFALESSTP
jgi:hypothetical protein